MVNEQPARNGLSAGGQVALTYLAVTSINKHADQAAAKIAYQNTLNSLAQRYLLQGLPVHRAYVLAERDMAEVQRIQDEVERQKRRQLWHDKMAQRAGRLRAAEFLWTTPQGLPITAVLLIGLPTIVFTWDSASLWWIVLVYPVLFVWLLLVDGPLLLMVRGKPERWLSKPPPEHILDVSQQWPSGNWAQL